VAVHTNLSFFAERVLKTEHRAAMDQFLRVQQVVTDFTATTLAAIPNVFGRLTYLSSLRDLSTGKYEHAGLAALYPPEAVQEALAYCHRELFQKILETPLPQQENDLRDCLAGMDGTTAETISHWKQLESYRILLPENAPDYLRELFFSNMRVLLEILKAQNSTVRSGG
jgi:hypothetical protein